VRWPFVNQFQFKPRPEAAPELLLIGSRQISLVMIRHPRAQRYLLRLRPDGVARVTIPRRGTLAEARQFVERNRAWLEEQIQRLKTHPRHPVIWQVGSEIWFRGQLERIESIAVGQLGIGREIFQVNPAEADFRPAIEIQLRQMAARELPPRVLEFAARHGLSVQRITVRNQKSRWGSCSRRGTISLNWRLIQTPDFVRDYIILHELAHLRQMNHSEKFWQEVERLCPNYQEAERWLKEHRELLR